MEDFQDWLEDLETQTLTDELKKEILEKVEILQEESYGLGYSEAKYEIIDHITFKM
jgi:hypothetical protein